jgi:hypothetical protein
MRQTSCEFGPHFVRIQAIGTDEETYRPSAKRGLPQGKPRGLS